MLVWACDMRSLQARGRSRREVARVRRDHHDLVWLAVEGLGGFQINNRLRLVVAGDLGAQDRIPREIVAPRDAAHQRDVAVRAWRDQELLVQALEPGRRI